MGLVKQFPLTVYMCLITNIKLSVCRGLLSLQFQIHIDVELVLLLVNIFRCVVGGNMDNLVVVGEHDGVYAVLSAGW